MAHAAWNPISDLGPADGLLLAMEPGKEPMRVLAKDGRIAWGDRSTNRVWSVASVDIDRVMKRIFDGESYVERRREAQESAKTEEAEFNRRAEEVRTKFPAAEGAAPPQEAQREMMALQQEYNRWLEGVRTRDEKLAAEQFEQAYRELVTAVEAVAEKESIDLVFRFYPTAEPFKATRAGEALAQIQARTFLKYPAAIDITPDVMKVLNLSE
jgi:Skp family chaperone for outer membrane proteins